MFINALREEERNLKKEQQVKLLALEAKHREEIEALRAQHKGKRVASSGATARYDSGISICISPAQIGSVITYRYQELTVASIPRFPTLVGERIDMDWGQVCIGFRCRVKHLWTRKWQ